MIADHLDEYDDGRLDDMAAEVSRRIAEQRDCTPEDARRVFRELLHAAAVSALTVTESEKLPDFADVRTCLERIVRSTDEFFFKICDVCFGEVSDYELIEDMRDRTEAQLDNPSLQGDARTTMESIHELLQRRLNGEE